MKRRSALINITKGFGIVTLSPSITGVLQSCSNEKNKNKTFNAYFDIPRHDKTQFFLRNV